MSVRRGLLNVPINWKKVDCHHRCGEVKRRGYGCGKVRDGVVNPNTGLLTRTNLEYFVSKLLGNTKRFVQEYLAAGIVQANSPWSREETKSCSNNRNHRLVLRIAPICYGVCVLTCPIRSRARSHTSKQLPAEMTGLQRVPSNSSPVPTKYGD